MLLIETDVFGDDRGFFMETYQKARFRKAGIAEEFVQDNHSGSVKGTLRGLHYQVNQPQGKLVRVVRGEVFDVAVDLRESSHTFGQWVGEHLSADNKKQLWIPEGFTHGFDVLSDFAEFIYKATDYYAPDCERCILWNDDDLSIDRKIQGEPMLSEKDDKGICFKDADVFK